MTASGPLGEYLAHRTRLIADAAPGLPAARSLAALTDEAICQRVEEASSAVRVPFALFALGGYGAGRLLPHSDIDLLVVSRGSAAELEGLIRSVLYPLWDAGLTVGHQVRSPKAQIAALGEDVRNATGFLTARVLAGDPALGERVMVDGFARMRRDAHSLRAAILHRERPGSPYLLEPDLKDGAGGQRDIDELVWHAAMLAGAPADSIEPLQAAGLLSADEARHVSEALEILTASRWLVHVAQNRGVNVLTLDDAELPDLDADAVQRSLAETNHTLGAVRARLGGRAPERARTFTLPDLRLLAAGGPADIAEAEAAVHARALDAVIPGFAALMTLRRPALSHRFTVGAHSLRAVQEAAAELDRLRPDRLTPAMHDATLVAALTHDIGKRDAAAGHAARGAEDAERAALALGLDARRAAIVRTLVAEHLTLADMAAHEDPTNEDAVLSAAARLGDAEIVAPLFALTAADMRATGPDVWTAWRAALVADLAARLEGALSPDVNGAGIVEAAEATRAEATRAAASVGSSRAILAFLEQAPLRYLARRCADDVLRDARLVQSIAGPGAPGRFGIGLRAGPAEGTWLIDVVTRDRPGLFTTLSGILALTGIDVLTAEAFTARNGIALDTFAVTSATRAAVDAGTLNTLERTLGLALAGRLELEVRLAERRRHYPARSVAAEARVEIGPRSAFTTRIRVRAADRVGLLHDLARAIDAFGLDVRRATITTLSGMADDVFEVTDDEGGPPDPDALRDRIMPELEAAARG